MTKGAVVTKELVEKVKNYLTNEKYTGLSQVEIATLSGTSASTVSRIYNGEYDQLLHTESKDECNIPITYETLKHLLACEYVVEAMLKMATLHDNIDGALFINNKATYSILRAYVPEDVENRLKELREEVENE